MKSCARMNGHYQQVGAPTQSSQAAAQFTHNTMRNLQAGTSNNPCQFWIANTGVQLQQSANFTYPSGQPSHWQTSAAPGGNQNYLQHSSTNRQSGNYSLSATFQQDFHQNSSQSSQSPPNVMRANTTHPQQDMSAHSNHTVLWNRTQGGKGLSNPQHWVDQSGMSTKLPYPYTTAATSPPQEKAVYAVPTAAHNRLAAHSQHGFSTSVPPPAYDLAVSQSIRSNGMTTISSSSAQRSHVSSKSHQTQQYSVRNSVGEATTSMNPNSYSSQYETSKTNELPLHPAATEKEMVRRKMIATIANYLRTSVTAVSDGRAPPCTSLKQFIAREFNQNVQSESYNSNASQPLPKTAQSFTSTQKSVDVPPQQTRVTHVSNVKTTRDGNKAATTFFPKNSVGSVNDASQPESISTTVPNNHEKPDILDMVLSVKTSDVPNNSSPGRTRAVAVVQPLSHESNQVANKRTCSSTISVLSEGTATDTALRNPEKSCASPENQHSAASKGSVSSSAPAGHLTLLKLLCSGDSGSEPTVNKQVDQRVEQSVPSKVPVSQSSHEDKSEMPKDPKAVLELSSVPTTPWTIEGLTKLIQEVEKRGELELKHPTNFHSFNKILCMFWGGKLYNVNYNPNLTWYTDLMADVIEICEDLTQDAVILSNVKYGFAKQLKNYYSLSDGEVYSEQPYKSTWLNVNEQLDDIDKEFGFPSSLKNRLYTSDSQPDQVEAELDTPPQTVSAPAELEPVDSSEENSTVETPSTQTASPLEMETADSGDPYYSFEIHVLPPEEAKIIFAQEESNKPQSMDTDTQPERPTKVMDDVLSDTTLKNEPVSPLEQFCCIARWKASISNLASSSKCQCEHEQSQENGDNQAKGGENVDSQFMSPGQPELCNHTIDSFEDDDKPHSYSDEEQDGVSHISINSSQSSVILLDDDDNDLPSNENEIPNQIPNVESDSEVKSTGNTQSCTSVSSDKEIEIGQAQLTSTNVAEPSLETEEQPIHATGALQTTGSGKHETVERNKTRPSDPPPAPFYPVFNQSQKRTSLADVDSHPVLEGPSKRGKLFEALKLSASRVRTAELVLFGSKPQGTCVSFGNRKSHISSPQSASARAPHVLKVKLSPVKIMSSETVPTGDYSVKRRLHEKWRRSLPPMKIRKQKCSFASLSGWSPKKAETVSPANTNKLPVSFGVKNGNTRPCLSLKRRRSLSNTRHKHKEGKRKKHNDSLDQPADQERREAENGSHADAPLQNQDVLKFSVLPNTFSFKDGSKGREETDDVLDKPDAVKGEDTSDDKTVQRAKGAWFPSPEKYSPLWPSAPKTLGLFHEYQKKYMKKKPSMDK